MMRGASESPMTSESKLSRRDFLLTTGLVATAAAAPTTVRAQTGKKWAGKTLHVQFWSGPEGENIIKHVVDPFKAETGAEVIVDYGYTSGSIAKLRAQKNDPQIDVFMMDDIGVYTTAPEGLLTKLDLSKMPNAKDIDPNFVVMDGLGIGFFTYTDSLVYNTNYFKTPPDSYEALWDPKLKGKVGIPTSEQMDAMKLLIAAAKLAGGDQKNIEPGFKKLAALKPNIHSFISDFAAAGELMKSGDIVLTFLATYLWKEQQSKGYPIKPTFKVKEGIYTTPACAVIPKGHPGPQELAELFINRALGVEAQTGMAQGLWYGPTNRKVKIDDPAIKDNLVMPENFKSVVPVDVPALAKVRQDWITRYDQTLKG
jgi:putative spermidine/putrescine transport system substrate-binding protein